MQELTKDEETVLEELCDARSRGESTRDYIDKMLYTKLSRVKSHDFAGNEIREEDPEFRTFLATCKQLVDKGLLEPIDIPMSTKYHFGELTPDGWSYFKEKERRENEQIKEKKSDRRHDYFVALFSLVGGAASGAISSITLHFLFGL